MSDATKDDAAASGGQGHALGGEDDVEAVTTMDSHSPAPPSDGTFTTMDSHSPIPPSDGTFTTMDSHSPTPPALDLDGTR
ncbi:MULTISPECIES: sigma-like protein [unclassified Streptomyces]|uniref:sigma-like protein n=1 Tax=unclassified Streptomyces TaxID=2593676 RepID=UPI0027E5A3E9|nr:MULTISPECIES: sigma-like protein [unclassified Streptomyces]